jgi:hypothetical protein
MYSISGNSIGSEEEAGRSKLENDIRRLWGPVRRQGVQIVRPNTTKISFCALGLLRRKFSNQPST